MFDDILNSYCPVGSSSADAGDHEQGLTAWASLMNKLQDLEDKFNKKHIKKNVCSNQPAVMIDLQYFKDQQMLIDYYVYPHATVFQNEA